MSTDRTPVRPTNLDPLRDRLRGPILEPHTDGWSRARTIWNAAYDREPSAIVRCRGAADVVATVRFARERDLPLAVRSGGHDFAGHCLPDGGLMLDLSLMKGIRVDPFGRRARVEAGVLWGEFDHEAQCFGLATTGGTVSTVGVAGYTLGGGTGYLARSRGLAVDNLVEADVVTADGELRRANEAEHPDLFWALRGGGGNFGIVTSFGFRLHRVGPEVLAGQVVHPFQDAGDALRFYRDFMANAPDELTCYPFLLKAPPLDAFPAEHHGRPVLVFVVAHVGPLESAQEAVRPLQEYGTPIIRGLAPMPYTVAQTMFDDAMPKGNRRYSKAQYFDDISDEMIETLLHFAADLQGPFTSAYFEPHGGAINQVASGATAFPHRDRGFGFHIVADWTDAAEDDLLREWATAFHDSMARHGRGGVYVNLLSHDEHDRVGEAYGPNFERLARIKAEFDPENFFRSNQNIAPVG